MSVNSTHIQEKHLKQQTEFTILISKKTKVENKNEKNIHTIVIIPTPLGPKNRPNKLPEKNPIRGKSMMFKYINLKTQKFN